MPNYIDTMHHMLAQRSNDVKFVVAALYKLYHWMMPRNCVKRFKIVAIRPGYVAPSYWLMRALTGQLPRLSQLWKRC